MMEIVMKKAAHLLVMRAVWPAVRLTSVRPTAMKASMIVMIDQGSGHSCHLSEALGQALELVSVASSG